MKFTDFRGRPKKFATGVIHYFTKDGRETQWSIGCMAWETEDDLRHHFEKYDLGTFIRAEVHPDKPKP